MSHPFRFSFASSILASMVLAGCASQQPTMTEGERIAQAYPASSEMAISGADTDGSAPQAERPQVVATGLRQPHHDVNPDVYEQHPPVQVEVLRTSRYQLVTSQATLEERQLLEQIVDVHIPPHMDTTVRDALRYTLDRTGYSLCEPQGRPQQLLYSRPLPSAHYDIGPMPLREALQVIAGPAFEVEADPIARLICYQVRNQRLEAPKAER